MNHISPPINRNGVWCVSIRENKSPFAKEIELIKCGSRENAFHTYRQIKKEQGKGF